MQGVKKLKQTGRPRLFDQDKVIEDAMKVFWEKGYEASSTDDLCKATGLGRSSLYNAFGNKHDLYKRTLKKYHEQWMAVQLNILTQPIPVKKRIENLFTWSVDRDFEKNSNGCFLIKASVERSQSDSDVQKWGDVHAKFLEQTLLKIVNEGIESHEIESEKTVNDLVQSLLCSYYGLRTLNATIRNKKVAEQMVQATMTNIA